MDRSTPAISTKLRPPLVHGPFLQRPRLRRQLELMSQRRVTLVCAGAGYGKTTLLSALQPSPTPPIWYSLHPSDRDLGVFASYLVQGIRRHLPTFGQPLLAALAGREGTTITPEFLARDLVNELGEMPGRGLTIILDDYQFVDGNQAIRKALDLIITHMPPGCHLVIATRRSPRLPSLPRLRMIGEVNDITEADLAFTPDEIRSLFSTVYGLQMSDRELSILAEQTEGWIIGLQLAGQSMRTGSSPGTTAPAERLAASKRDLFEYLAEEVYRRQPTNVQAFLRESSIFSTLVPEDCDAVLGRIDSVQILDHIQRNNLFATELDGGPWRYHHLFRDFLRQQLGKYPGRTRVLHQQAGSHYEAGGNLSRAIGHYLAALDYRNAARLISVVGPSMLRTSRFDTLTYWITQVPEGEISGLPYLLFLQAEVYQHQGHYDLSMEWAERAAQSYAGKGDGIGLSRVLCSKAYQVVWREGRYVEADALYHQALDCLGPENRRERADLLRCIALIQLPAANPSAAVEAYQQALRMYEALGDREGLLSALINPGTWVYWLRGAFAEGLVSLGRGLELARALGSKHLLSECLGCMAITLRYLDRCDEALEHAQQALSLSREIGAVQLEAHNLTYLGFAYTGGRNPDLEAARRCLAESVALAEKEGNERIRISALIGDVLALRRQGKTDEAIEVGQRLMNIAEASTDRWLIATAQMNSAAALIGRDDRRAEMLLTQSREEFQRLEDRWNLTCANFWMAVLLDGVSPSRSLAHLEACLELAKAGGYEFWFLEEGRLCGPLLRTAIRHGIRTEYCRELLFQLGTPEAVDIIGAAPRIQTALPTTSHEIDDGRLSPPGMRICCLGNLRVSIGNRPIEEDAWQRTKVKGLLAFLAASPGHTATKEEIIEQFWADHEVGAARASLSRVLHLLRRVLDPEGRYPSPTYVASDHSLVRLRTEQLSWVDLDEYQAHIDAAQKAERTGNPDLAEREYQAAEARYRGEFLTDEPYEEWTMAPREQYRAVHLLALEKLAKARVRALDYEAAIPYLRSLLAEDDAREDAHALLIQCLARAGRRGEAVAQYHTCRRILQQDLQLAPLEATTLLYDRLVAGETI